MRPYHSGRVFLFYIRNSPMNSQLIRVSLVQNSCEDPNRRDEFISDKLAGACTWLQISQGCNLYYKSIWKQCASSCKPYLYHSDKTLSDKSLNLLNLTYSNEGRRNSGENPERFGSVSPVQTRRIYSERSQPFGSNENKATV